MITIPEHFWTQMLHEFAKERREVEQVCYFDGILQQHGGTVTTLTVPAARLHAGRFEVGADSMSEAGKHLRRFRLKRLAQVHTHPTEWTGHSPWDDAHAYSQATGAISIVLPSFARKAPKLDDAGVHVRTEAGWRQLSRGEIASRIQVVPALLDFRPSLRRHDEQKSIEPARRDPWWSALAFWRHK